MVSRITRPYRLLIADDDVSFRDTLRELFAPYFETLVAGSGGEAVEIAAQQPIDIALFDVHMPVLTGVEAVRRIKTINVLAPCILMTADMSEELWRDATAARAFSVLAKPMTRRQLFSTVSTALEEVYNDRSTRALLS